MIELTYSEAEQLVEAQRSALRRRDPRQSNHVGPFCFVLADSFKGTNLEQPAIERRMVYFPSRNFVINNSSCRWVRRRNSANGQYLISLWGLDA